MENGRNTEAKELVDSADDVIEIMSLMQQCMNYFPLGSVDWFLMTAFCNELDKQLGEMRTKVNEFRPSRSVRKALNESFITVAKTMKVVARQTHGEGSISHPPEKQYEPSLIASTEKVIPEYSGGISPTLYGVKSKSYRPEGIW